ncbi:MAG TPA: hypothetical protein VGB82_11830 [Alphaproteobacteria bacterium]
MRRRIYAVAAMAVGLTFSCAAAASEVSDHPPSVRLAQLLAQRGGNSLPRGSYQQSCTCQVSGGTTLLCFCNNVQGRMFETDIDLRACPLPKDIKNCNGKLTCVDPKSTGDC